MTLGLPGDAVTTNSLTPTDSDRQTYSHDARRTRPWERALHASHGLRTIVLLPSINHGPYPSPRPSSPREPSPPERTTHRQRTTTNPPRRTPHALACTPCPAWCPRVSAPPCPRAPPNRRTHGPARHGGSAGAGTPCGRGGSPAAAGPAVNRPPIRGGSLVGVLPGSTFWTRSAHEGIRISMTDR